MTLEYNEEFNGWLGKLNDDFNYENLNLIANKLAKYYKENSTSGQKLIVGYDNKLFSKKIAEYFSSVIAENGLKVFFSNKPAPTSSLIISSNHKKSMGAISFSADSFSFEFMGMKAFNSKGKIISDNFLNDYVKDEILIKKINEKTFKKMLSKGTIEPFDASICYEQFLENKINFKDILSINKIMFNPNFGSGNNYFDNFLSEKSLHGYTIDSEINYNFEGVDVKSAKSISKLYEDMVFHGTELGFTCSPDCINFSFLVEPHSLSAKEIINLLLENFSKKNMKGKVIISNDLDVLVINKFKDEFESVYVDNSEIINYINENDYLLAIDSLERIYFHDHSSPDALLTAFYLLEIFNNKEITPKLLQQKINIAKGVL